MNSDTKIKNTTRARKGGVEGKNQPKKKSPYIKARTIGKRRHRQAQKETISRHMWQVKW